MTLDSGDGLAILHVVGQWPTTSETFVRHDVEDSQGHASTVAVLATGWGHGQMVSIQGRNLDNPVDLRKWRALHLSRGMAEVRRDIRARGLREVPRIAASFGIALSAAVRLPDAGAWVIHAQFLARTADVGKFMCALLPQGAALLVTAHGADAVFPQPTSALPGRLAGSDIVICASRAVERAALGRHAQTTTRVRYCSVEIPEEPAARATGAPGLDRPLRLITVGRLNPQKGWDVVVAAAAVLSQRGVAYAWECIGSGSEAEEDRLRELGERLGADGLVWRGSVDHTETLARITAADAMVQPSVQVPPLTDGLPVVILEACARGVPVITTAVVGIPEVVDEDTGWLVPPTPDAIADAVATLMADPDHGRPRGARARTRVAALCERRANATLLGDTYQEAIRGRLRPTGLSPATTEPEGASRATGNS